MKSTTRLYSGLAVAAAATAMFIATAVPAQAATLSMSGSQSCTSTGYYAGVHGKNVTGSLSSTTVSVEFPPGTQKASNYGAAAASYQSTKPGGTWAVKSTSTTLGLDTSYSGGFCAPATA